MKSLKYLVTAICLVLSSLAIAGAGPGGIIKLAEPALKRIDKNPFLVHLPPGSPIEETAQQLFEILTEGDPSNVAIIIGSSDTEAMAQIMIKALARLEPKSMSGTDMIFVGDKEYRKEIVGLAKKAGIRLRFVRYK